MMNECPSAKFNINPHHIFKLRIRSRDNSFADEVHAVTDTSTKLMQRIRICNNAVICTRI